MQLSLIVNLIALAAFGAASPAARHHALHQERQATPVALAPRATSTALCPTYDGKSYVDSNSKSYAVQCHYSNNGAVIGSSSTTVNLGQCMTQCDAKSGCSVALFHTVVNMCYFVGSGGSNTYNDTYNVGVKSATTSSAAAATATTVAVTFDELVSTTWGQSVMLVGSISELGNWAPTSGVAMSANQYTTSNPLWSVTVNLAAGTSFQYKYVVIETDGTVDWEQDPNHSYTVSSATTVSNTWQQVSTAATQTNTASLASTVTGTVTVTSTTSAAATATCTNAPNSRTCWGGGYDINTDFDDAWPTTGKTVSYTWDITNTTLSPDGYGREVLAINGQYPGPTIYADWGDDISVTVTNSLANNGTTIHMHGIRQFENNGQDGVPGVTECPLAPGQTKTYTFKATQYGTSWYHSHFSAQYGDGILGPIVIQGPATANYDIDLGPLPITDWYYASVASHAALAEHSNALPPEADNALINGSMTSAYGGSYYVSPLTAGSRHRVRLINTAVDNHFVVSFDNHEMEVIAADFVPVVPYNVTTLFIGIGQRYDVIITANQSPGAYWFRADVQDQAGCGTNFNNGNIKSVFAYAGHATETPISTAYTYTQRCTDETGLVPHWDSYVPTQAAIVFNELETDQVQVNNADGSITLYWQVNGTAMDVNWEMPTLEYVKTGNTSYPAAANVIQLPDEGIWTYWVIQSIPGDPYNIAVPHPIHLHGHDFYVLGASTDTWTSADASGLNYDNPTRRDVAMLPSGGYLALAFQTDNPGAWLMHCHIAWHAGDGLAVQFLESPSTITNYPSDFDSQCSAWDSYYNNKPQYLQDDSGI